LDAENGPRVERKRAEISIKRAAVFTAARSEEIAEF
jgi:hypothetical protein